MSCMMNSLAVNPTAPTMSMSSSYGCTIFLPTTNKSFWSNPSFAFSQFLSIQSKPNKPQLISCSHVSPFPLSISFIEKKTKNSTFMCFVAEENNALFQEEEENVMDDQEWEEKEQGKTVGDIEEEWVPSEDCKIYVGNLPYEIHSEQLAGLFQEAGVVERVEVKYDRETEQSRGFGFVSMHCVEEAERAVQMFNGYELNGRLLTVNKAAPRGTHPERQSRGFDLSNRIFVGNLPWEVDNAGLMEIFSEHGKVMDARVVLDKESGKSRGFGFVTMSTKSELNEAISNLDGQIFNGRPIIVNVAKERNPRSI